MKKKLLIPLLTLILFSCKKDIHKQERYVAKYWLSLYHADDIEQIEMFTLTDDVGIVATKVTEGNGKPNVVYKDQLDITEAIAYVNPGDQLVQFYFKITDKKDKSFKVTKSFNTKKPLTGSWWGDPIPYTNSAGINADHHGVGLEYFKHRGNHNFTIKNTSSVVSTIIYSYNDTQNELILQPGETFYFRTFDEHFFFQLWNETLFPNASDDESIEILDRLEVDNVYVNDVEVRILKEYY